MVCSVLVDAAFVIACVLLAVEVIDAFTDSREFAWLTMPVDR